jgi:hypothetical protein
MKKMVTIPFAGYATVFLDVEEGTSRTDIIGIAIDKAAQTLHFEEVKDQDVEIGEWELYENLTEGNVFYAPIPRAEVEDVGEK